MPHPSSIKSGIPNQIINAPFSFPKVEGGMENPENVTFNDR
jgi:hypothetical protein